VYPPPGPALQRQVQLWSSPEGQAQIPSEYWQKAGPEQESTAGAGIASGQASESMQIHSAPLQLHVLASNEQVRPPWAQVSPDAGAASGHAVEPRQYQCVSMHTHAVSS